MPASLAPHYRATVSRTLASRPRVLAHRVSLVGGAPSVELDGDAASWPAAQLLLSSLGLGLLTAFETIAARDGIGVRAWTATLDGVVEASPEGLIFTSIIVCLDLDLTGDLADVDATILEARQACLVVNSLRVPVVIETTIPLSSSSSSSSAARLVEASRQAG